MGTLTRWLFAKARRLLGRIPFVRDALAMYFCMVDGRTPLWVRGVLALALLYFLSPLDLFPDVIPLIGYGDDAAIVTWALALVHRHITVEHRGRARALLG